MDNHSMETIYLSIPKCKGSCGYLFHEIPSTSDFRNEKYFFRLNTKLVKSFKSNIANGTEFGTGAQGFIYFYLSLYSESCNSYQRVKPRNFFFSAGSFPRQSGQTTILTLCILVFFFLNTNLLYLSFSRILIIL